MQIEFISPGTIQRMDITDLEAYTDAIIDGHEASKEELLALAHATEGSSLSAACAETGSGNSLSVANVRADSKLQTSLEELCRAADKVRQACCGKTFDMCSIINVKSGRCSENCAFCAQSAHWHSDVAEYPFLACDTIVAAARDHADRGAQRFSLVASGRRLNKQELEEAAAAIRAIKEEGRISVCASLGLLSEDEFAILREAGLMRVHNNLETSFNHWPQICTTHSYDEKIKAIRNAQAAGLEICSGGIIGMGETMEDRIDMALTLRELGVCSVPVNVLNPIPGTPLEQANPLPFEEILCTIALFRFALPHTAIRLAGGRTLLPDAGKECFVSGANATISGDMLTTAGYSFESDTSLVEALDYEIGLFTE